VMRGHLKNGYSSIVMYVADADEIP
jgi:hypothetical protein